MTDPQRTITQVMEQLLAYVQHKRTCPKSTMVTLAGLGHAVVRKALHLWLG
jgi:hypothetical protein